MPRNEEAPPRVQAGAAIYEDGLDGAAVHARNKAERAKAEREAEAAQREAVAEHKRHVKRHPRLREQRAVAALKPGDLRYSPRLGRMVKA